MVQRDTKRAKEMISDYRKIKLKNGLNLHARIKEIGSQVWLIATHGIGEHLERHNYLSDLFGHEMNIFQYDLRGHGKTAGERGDIKYFDQFMEDLVQILEFLRSEYRMKKYILFGHSMGALVTSGVVQNYLTKDFYPQRIFLSAPPVSFPGLAGMAHQILPQKFLGRLASVKVSVSIGGLVNLRKLSHLPEVYEDYVNDPLNIMKVPTKLLLGLAYSAKKIYSRPLKTLCPSFAVVGSADEIVGPEAVIHYFTFVEKAVHLKVIEGAYHEIHNEVEKFRRPYFKYLKASLREALYT